MAPSLKQILDRVEHIAISANILLRGRRTQFILARPPLAKRFRVACKPVSPANRLRRLKAGLPVRSICSNAERGMFPTTHGPSREVLPLPRSRRAPRLHSPYVKYL